MLRLGPLRDFDPSRDRGLTTLKRRLQVYLRRPPEEREQRRVPVDGSYFLASVVRRAVAERCRHKCVFCEREVPSDEGVGHFRPWRDALSLRGEVDPYHYAWLAYEPDNLIRICAECASLKGTSFPVRGARAPYLTSASRLRRSERALIVDAYHDNTDRHFDYLTDGWCEPLTEEGRATVAVLALNGDHLVRNRRTAVRETMHRLSDALERGDGLGRPVVDLDEQHAGARLNVLKRILQRSFLRSDRRVGQLRTLSARLPDLLGELDEDARRRLADRIGSLPAVDADRPRWDGREWDPPRASPSITVRRLLSTPPTGGVREVALDNFKGVEGLRLRLNRRRSSSRGVPCLMLLGENAVGKSTVLQAVALALIGAVEARRLARALALDADDLLRDGGGEGPDGLGPVDGVATVSFAFGSEPATLRVSAAERRIVGREGGACLVLGYGPRRFFREGSTRADTPRAKVRTLFDPLATLPHPGTWLNQLGPGLFGQVAKVMRLVLTLDDADELERDDDGVISVRIAGAKVPIGRMSEGYRSVFAMVADIVRELLATHPVIEDAEAVVLIDEVETNLHPRWKMRIMSSLRAAFPNVQFIATTHDPLCLRGMDDGEVVVLQRDPGGRVESLQGLPSVKGMRADQILTSDYFGLSSTIDPETELDVARYVGRVEDAGEAAPELIVPRLTIGDDARGQVVHEALRTFIRERERPTRALRIDVRADAIRAVLDALRRGDDETTT